MPLDAAGSVVSPVSPSPESNPRVAAAPRSGEEPSSDNRNFSSSVNKNGEDEEDDTFWGDAQHIKGPFSPWSHSANLFGRTDNSIP